MIEARAHRPKADWFLSRALVSSFALVLCACVSVPPPRPTALDPANPTAPESPAPALSPLVPGPPPAEPQAPAEPPPAPPVVPEPAKPKPAATRKAPDYTCPMHPEISAPKPGRCPKCGMKLVPRASLPGAKK